MIERIRVHDVGPIREADIRFGDLTVFVGPQATGKSILLQLIKLLLDKQAIHETLGHFGIEWSSDLKAFLELYFGEGMSSLWNGKQSRLIPGKANKALRFESYARRRRSQPKDEEVTAFYIPAQRVMSLRDGMTRPFTDYKVGDPFVLRDFSERLHQLVQNEFNLNKGLFPQKNRLNDTLRKPLEKHIFGGFELRIDSFSYQSRLTLGRETGGAFPYLVWSAGQREFVPMLLGLYWLLPPAAASRRNELQWVVVEEPEMGLHPNGIAAVINLILELRSRGYRIFVSTHSPHVLDIVWALRFLRKNRGTEKDVLRLLGLNAAPRAKRLAENALESDLKTYYFSRDGTVRDISNLDPGADDVTEAGWGGLTEFSGKVGAVVAEVAARNAIGRP